MLNSIQGTPQAEADGYWPSMREFKTALCDENELIAEALRTTCRRWLRAPILDVGAGLGDIAAAAFPDLTAVLLDLHLTPEVKSDLHTSVRGDFFKYAPKKRPRPRTVLLCHVLQYIDDDWDRFRLKLADLDPETVVAVTNDNDGQFGSLVNWVLANVSGSNPEDSLIQLDMQRYQLRQTVPITATLKCPDFATLANHLVVGLLDAVLAPETIAATVKKLQELLDAPTMRINQTIYCYEKI